MARWIPAFAVLLLACSDPTGAAIGPVRFEDEMLDFGEGLSGQVLLTNDGTETLTSVRFRAEGLPDGATVDVFPAAPGRVEPGRRLSFTVRIRLPPAGLTAGAYTFDMLVLVDGAESDRVEIRFRV